MGLSPLSLKVGGTKPIFVKFQRETFSIELWTHCRHCESALIVSRQEETYRLALVFLWADKSPSMSPCRALSLRYCMQLRQGRHPLQTLGFNRPLLSFIDRSLV